MENKPHEYFPSMYYGDGEDNFSKTPWEACLWVLLRETYARKTAESKLYGNSDFVAPDYATLIECEEALENCGIERTWRDGHGNFITRNELWKFQ